MQSPPTLSWVSESKLELADIRAYREKVRPSIVTSVLNFWLLRLSVSEMPQSPGEQQGLPSRLPTSTTPATWTGPRGSAMPRTFKWVTDEIAFQRLFFASLQDLKAKTKESLREQRATFKAGPSLIPDTTPSSSKKFQVTPSGSIKLVSDNRVTTIQHPNKAKKVLISKVGKIVGHQITGGVAG